MENILKNQCSSFEKSIQKWKFSKFLAIFTYLIAPNEIIAIFLIYSQPSGTRKCNFYKNRSQKISTKIIESSLV